MTDHSINAEKRAVIARKVRALLGKTVENGATEAEALTASEMADRLMAEYDLTYTDVEAEVRGEKYGNRDRKFSGGSFRRRSRHEVQFVVRAIGNYWDCNSWFRGKDGNLVFFGTADNTEFAHQMTDLLRIAMDTEWRRFFKDPNRQSAGEHGRLVRKSFMRGMAHRLSARLKDLKAARDKAAETIKASDGRSLVLVRQDVTKAKWNQFCKETNFKLGRATKQKVKRWSEGAYYAGEAAADKVDLGTSKLNRAQEKITCAS